MSRRAALVLLPALLVLHAAPAPAQSTECPAAAAVTPKQMLGAWRAEVEGLPTAPVQLEPNPRHAGSLSGTIDRDDSRSRVAADIDAGEFTMEESGDGVHIAATWLGEVIPDTCGQEIRGSWEPAGGAARGFVLRRVR